MLELNRSSPYMGFPPREKTISIWLTDKEWPKHTPFRWPSKFEKLNDVRSLKFGPIACELRSVSVKLSALLVGTVYRTFLVMRQVAVS